MGGRFEGEFVCTQLRERGREGGRERERERGDFNNPIHPISANISDFTCKYILLSLPNNILSAVDNCIRGIN